MQVFDAFMFNSTETLTGYMSTCSGGRATIARANSRSLVVELPCGGLTHNGAQAWDHTACSADNLLRVGAEADWWVAGWYHWYGVMA